MIKRGSKGKLFSKGQETGGTAAALVAIITLFMILYLLFLPPTERERLLGEDLNGNSISTSINERIILEEHPGLVDYLHSRDVEHDLQTVSVFTKTEGAIIHEENSINVKNEVFSEQQYNLTFAIDNLDNYNNLELNFLTQNAEGNLKIELNGITIFSKVIEGANIEPIKLKKNFLVNGNNIITFSVGGPGLIFWRTNEYQLSKVTISSDIKDNSKAKAEQTFYVANDEKKYINTVNFRYLPDCLTSKVGILVLKINDEQIFSGIPDCGALVNIDLPGEMLNEGKNVFSAKVETGSYLLDRLMLKVNLQNERNLTYSFELNDTELEELQDNYELIYTMKFIDNSEKSFTTIINNDISQVTTKDTKIEKNITNIAKAYNTIKIIPEDKFYLTDILVQLNKR